VAFPRSIVKGRSALIFSIPDLRSVPV